MARVWSSFISLKTNLWVNHGAVVRSKMFTKLNVKILHFRQLFSNGM